MTYPEIPVTLDVHDTLYQYWLTFDQGLYLISDKNHECQGALTRRSDGSWYQVSGKFYPGAFLERMGEAIDNFEYLAEHSFGFGLEMKGRLLHCEVLLGEYGYCLYLNHRFIGEIRMNFDSCWEAVSGSLPPACLLFEIGERIEAHFA